ncbi:MAG: TIGR04255 family protein [Oscillospiraceae bacterium]
MRMFSNQPRKFYRRSPLIEVICQLRFPDILKIEAHEPADFQDAIRQVYPQYAKRIEQLPPQNAGGKIGRTVNNTSSFPPTAAGRSV